MCNWLNCLCKTQVHGWLAKTMTFMIFPLNVPLYYRCNETHINIAKIVSWETTLHVRGGHFTKVSIDFACLTVEPLQNIIVIFLAATKQLYDWFIPSVCPSVCPSVRHTFFTMFPSSYHHEIFRSYYPGQKWCPCKRSRSEVKGQGHRGQHPT